MLSSCFPVVRSTNVLTIYTCMYIYKYACKCILNMITWVIKFVCVNCGNLTKLGITFFPFIGSVLLRIHRPVPMVGLFWAPLSQTLPPTYYANESDQAHSVRNPRRISNPLLGFLLLCIQQKRRGIL